MLICYQWCQGRQVLYRNSTAFPALEDLQKLDKLGNSGGICLHCWLHLGSACIAGSRSNVAGVFAWLGALPAWLQSGLSSHMHVGAWSVAGGFLEFNVEPRSLDLCRPGWKRRAIPCTQRAHWCSASQWWGSWSKSMLKNSFSCIHYNGKVQSWHVV